jgi:hypothetical protein
MSQIQSLLESAGNGWKNMQSDAARLASKWEKTGLLEGFSKEIDKNNMSLILENQAKQLVVEQSSVGGGAGYGAFATGNGAEWAGIALPLVRKVFGQIAAKEFVSVQPMNLPSGLVFYLDFQYGGANGNAKTPFAANGSLYGTQNTTNFGTAASNLGQTFGDGGLYGAGKFTYSTNQFSSSLVAGTVATATSASINFDSRLDPGALKTLTIATSSIPNFDAEAVRGFVPTTSSVAAAAGVLPLSNVYPAFTTLSGGNIVFVVSGSDVATNAGAGYKIFYNKATAMSPYNVGDFEAGNDFAVPNAANQAEIAIPEINIQMKSEAIVAKTKKLKAVWTPEFAQDLNAYQALDAEAEVTNIMSEYISLEIDLEILDMLIEDAAAGTEYWSAINNEEFNGTTFAANTSGFYNTQGGWFQTLGTKMQKLSNKIHQLTLRGGANFMVLSPSVATILESIPGFAATSDGDVTKNYAFGVQKAGSLNNRYDVYKNPYMNENTILMGYRGSQFLESGAVFAPYIPLIMTPLIYDPETFTPRKGLLTRYAKKMIRPEFYGKIYVNGLNTL